MSNTANNKNNMLPMSSFDDFAASPESKEQRVNHLKRLFLSASILITVLTLFIDDITQRRHHSNHNIGSNIMGMEQHDAHQVIVSDVDAAHGKGGGKQDSAIPMKQTQTVIVNGKEVTVETQTATWADEADDPEDNEDNAPASGLTSGPRWQKACPQWKNARQKNRLGIDSFFHHTTVSIISTAAKNTTGLDAGKVGVTSDNNSNWTDYYPVQYQCVGEEYDEFSHHMKRYTKHEIMKGHRTKCWGKRWHPVPANKKVLVIGNSHSMQVARSMMAYAGLEAIADFKLTIVPGNGKLAIVKFKNGGELTMLGNYPGVAAVDLAYELESILGVPLNSFDAVIMGLFNRYVL